MRIKRIFIGLGYGLLILGLAGCTRLSSFLKGPSRIEGNVLVLTLPAYSGPKAKIVVSDFEIKAAKANSEIGIALRDILTSALTKSNRFIIVEHQELSTAIQEQELNNLNTPSGGTKAEKVKTKPADLLVNLTISEFQPRPSGGAAGIGGGGGSGGILNALLGARANNKANITLDIRIIDIASSETIAASRIQGQASDISGAIMTAPYSEWILSPKLSDYANTPMDKAIRICIIEATRYISGVVPRKYYKY